jgi:hypothetical protein
MKNKIITKNESIFIAIGLLLASALIYVLQILLFRNNQSTMFYLLQDLAFLPIEILIVTFILEKILDDRSKQEKLRKVQAVINVFFTEMGRDCIPLLTKFIGNYEDADNCLKINEKWDSRDFSESILQLKKLKCVDAVPPYDFETLHEFLSQKRQFMLSLLQNQYLIEHDEFTDLLWALFHVLDELQYRHNLETIPESDIKHILLDIRRAYLPILVLWVHYMEKMKVDYPHLFRFLLKNPVI